MKILHRRSNDDVRPVEAEMKMIKEVIGGRIDRLEGAFSTIIAGAKFDSKDGTK